MTAIKDLLNNEHGLFGVLLILGAIVLCAIGIMTAAQWQAFAEWIFTTWMGGHALLAFANRPAGGPSAPPAGGGS